MKSQIIVAKPSKTTNTTTGKKISAILGTGMSLPWAEFISYWSNWILVGALLVGLAATYGIVISGNIKEAALKREIADAGERASRADERAAEATRKAEEERLARLKLIAALEPRRLSASQAKTIADGLRGKISELNVAAISDDREAVEFATDIFIALNTMAGLKSAFFSVQFERNRPAPLGISFLYDPPDLQEAELVSDFLATILPPPINIMVSARPTEFASVPTKTLYVGPKPPPLDKTPWYFSVPLGKP